VAQEGGHDGGPPVGGWLLAVTEDLLGAGAGRLQQRLLYSTAGHPCLVLDLTAVDRVDSTSMGVLINEVKRLRAGNGQLRPAVACGDVARGAARHWSGQGAAAVPPTSPARCAVTPRWPKEIS